MTNKTRNWLILFLSIPAAVVIAIIGMLIFDAAQPLPPVQPLPNPNGYDDFVKAGEVIILSTNNLLHYDEMTQQKLRILVENNAEALQLARTGMQRKCQVPLDYSPTSETVLIKHSAILHLAQALAAEGRLAEMENRHRDATKSYLDLVHLGNKSAHGGIIIDQLVGTAMEAVGTSHLQKLVERLDAKSCRETAAALETLDSQRQTWNEIMQQERAWSRRAFPDFRYRLVALITSKSTMKIDQHAEQQFKKQQMKTRQLLIDLAARAYELDKGHRPTSLADLVPDYLKSIPQDPLTGTNMVYSPR